jgi:hypothetical protein
MPNHKYDPDDYIKLANAIMHPSKPKPTKTPTMPKYVATIYFECDSSTDSEKAVQTAVERLEQYSPDVSIDDSYVEELDCND